MRFIFCALLSLAALFSPSFVLAEKGFSIEGGLMYDRPIAKADRRPYTNLQGGLGYTANLGYDFFDRGGVELGVMYSTHAYDFDVVGSAIKEDDASKTTIFFKLRGILYKGERFEIITAAGVGFFDITGKRIIQENIVDEDFSGPGFTGNIDFRYYASPGLAITFYFGANLVDYNRYELFNSKSTYPGKMPSGNSLNWGLTFFHRIGIP
jgi:hypothetical protein